jgi:hypothetical protein
MSLHPSDIIFNCVWPTSEVFQKTYPQEDLRTLRTRVSEILKRSSTMRGGEYYRQKKLLQTPTPSKRSKPSAASPQAGQPSDDSDSDDAVK